MMHSRKEAHATLSLPASVSAMFLYCMRIKMFWSWRVAIARRIGRLLGYRPTARISWWMAPVLEPHRRQVRTLRLVMHRKRVLSMRAAA